MSGMDFSKFRASGDLSDMVVVVEGQENHLHRFPLYAKCDYLCCLAKESGQATSPSIGKYRVVLEDFPGGQPVFSLVADFCYSMAPSVTKDNVVQVRCAAHLLQMSGPGNLADTADKFLQDAVASAKLSRSSSSLITLLLHCASVGQLAADCGVVDLCTDALVETWLRSPPSKFLSSSSTPSKTRRQVGSAFSLQSSTSAFTAMKPSTMVGSLLSTSPSTSSPTAGENTGLGCFDETELKGLSRLPQDWFATLLKRALDRGVRPSLLADMAVRYVSRAIDNDSALGGDDRSTGNKDEDAKNKSVNGSKNSVPNGHSTPVNDTATETATAHPLGELNVEDLDKDVDSSMEGQEAESGEGSAVDPVPHIPDHPVDLGELLDTVLSILPEDAFNLATLTIDWLTKVLRIATARGCKCRHFLVAIAAEKLSRLHAEDLCLVSPSVLHDIVLEARNHAGGSDDDNNGETSAHNSSEVEKACALVDTYLGEMAKKGVLTSDTYRLLAGAAPPSVPRNHDHLYDVLEYVLKAEKESLSSEQKQDLLSTINLDLVTEDTLKKALDSDLVAPDLVAQASLKLCAGLRSELESVKYIAQMQEEELHKYQSSSHHRSASPLLGLHSSSRTDRLAVISTKIDSDSGFSDTCGQDGSSSKRISRDRERDRDVIPERDSSAASDSVRAAQSVLTTARSKLAMPLYAGHRPYLPSSALGGSGSSHGSEHGQLEHDISLQDELEFRIDRSSFRSLEPRLRSRHLPNYYSTSPASSTSSRTELQGHHRSTYFPYSSRF